MIKEPPIIVRITKRSLDAWVDYYLGQGKTLAQAYDLISKRCEKDGVENYYSCYESFRVAYYKR